MTIDQATVSQLHNSLELSHPDREAAQAVASGLRHAKADNTRRAYISAWANLPWPGCGSQNSRKLP